MTSQHPWKFVFSGVDCVGASMTHVLNLYNNLKIDYYQDLLISSGYFSDPRFIWVGMTIRYGRKNDRKTEFQGISKKYECIDLAKELDMRILLIADKIDVDVLMDFFKIASLDSLIEAGLKYELNPSAIEILKQERAKLGQIPDWEYEMDEHPEIMLKKYKDSIGRPIKNEPLFGMGGCIRVPIEKELNQSISLQCLQVRDEYIMPLLKRTNYFENKKFSFIFLVINVGQDNDRETYMAGNTKRYEDVTLARDLDVRLLDLDRKNGFHLLYDFLKINALDALIDAGIKYKVNSSAVKTLKEERTKLGEIPDWEDKMEKHPEILLNKYKKSLLRNIC